MISSIRTLPRRAVGTYCIVSGRPICPTTLAAEAGVGQQRRGRGRLTQEQHQMSAPKTAPVPVKQLKLDLANFRTVAQSNEFAAIEAMISASPDRFWALVESLLDDGYLPTENIIVLQGGGKTSDLFVKEGNRRVAALKLAHGLYKLDKLSIPGNIEDRLKAVTTAWKVANGAVPCAIYPSSQGKLVDRIVTLAHGKSEKAGRDQWNAVARARHNRSMNGNPEPALDLLEEYLRQGKNLTDKQRGRWAGTYPLTVLAEAMKRLAPRLGLKTSAEISKRYPKIPNREEVEAIVQAIGMEAIGFDNLRDKQKDILGDYGVPLSTASPSFKPTGPRKGAGTGTGGSGSPTSPGTGAATPGGKAQKAAAAPITDVRSVRRILRAFTPRGKKREKVATLRDEAIRLDIKRTPFAFCFVLRSLFEVSAKAYCSDHASAGGPKTTDTNGREKALGDLLRDITKHLTGNNADKAKVKTLHGAMAELGKNDGLLSVTSLNQLVHSPYFSVAPDDVARLFANVFPLLEEMNA
ncbi:MAG: hypothetical protein Q8K82_05595 [Gemmatimonadaceae bacterium]|nr:hypothetical protein [Gemmatimonadaceae bacterium]